MPGYEAGYKAGFQAGVDSLYNKIDAPSFVRVEGELNVYSRLPIVKPGARPLIIESLRHWERLLYLYYHADLQSGMSVEDALARDTARQKRVMQAFHEAKL